MLPLKPSSMLARRNLTAPPDMELYYPLSPTRAMFYVKSTDDEHPHTITDSAEIERYNKLIAEHAHEQLFGNSACALEVYKEYI